jgi:thioredoxin reductase (NADPH)
VVGGDSAVTEAIYLQEIGVDITLLHRSDALDAQKALRDRLLQKGIAVLFNTEIRQLLGVDQLQQIVLFNNKTCTTQLRDTRCVFVSIGYTPAVDLARQLGLELTAGDYIQNDSCRTSIRGLYVAGDVTGGYKQIVTASGQGAEAAITVFHDMKDGLL